MIDVDADIIVLGSSFAGSLMAMIAERIGLRPVLVDRKSHPRFALGESTTPISNMVLRDLAERYDLPRLIPLTKYGTWQRELPQLTCGKKRGFSFFKHKPRELFCSDDNHSNELLVTASLDDEHSDTHWLRSDVDAYFAAEVERNGIPHIDRTEITAIEQDHSGDWKLRGHRDDEPVQIKARFVIDSTGEGGFLGKAFGIKRESRQICTNSRAIYAHFDGLTEWKEIMTAAGCSLADHPYDCDAAAVHQILDGAWMWQLRFDNGVTSAGLTIDNARHPLDDTCSPDDEWTNWLSRYPTVAEQFALSRIVGPVPGRLIRTGRLQRQWASLVGPNWAMLPQTAGIIDALFSTGIAASLCGIERLATILERHWNRDSLPDSLREYENAVRSEIALVDEIVGGCFNTFERFELFTAVSMLYFAGATTYERRRAECPENDALFLCAGDENFRKTVSTLTRLGGQLCATKDLQQSQVDEFTKTVAKAIAPYNTAGLCDPSAHNMYRYTAPPNDVGV